MTFSKTRQFSRLLSTAASTTSSSNSSSQELLPWLPPPKRSRPETPSATNPRTTTALSNAAVLGAITRAAPDDPKQLLALYSQAARQPGFRHDYPTYKALIYRLARLKRLGAVRLLLSRMRSEGLPCGPGILVPLIDICPDEAVDLLLSSTPAVHEKVFSKLLDLLIRTDRLDVARTLFSDEQVIRRLGFPIRVRNYIGLVRAYCERGQIVPAIEILDLMGGRGSVPDVFCYGSLIGGICCRGGPVDDAFAMVDQMRRSGREPDVVVYNTLVHGCVRNGEMERAESIVREMEERGIDGDAGTYNTMIGGICGDHGSEVADGVKVLYGMMERGVPPDVITFTTLMSPLCREGKVPAASALFGMMVRMGIPPDAACCRVLLGSGVLRQQCDGGL